MADRHEERAREWCAQWWGPSKPERARMLADLLREVERETVERLLSAVCWACEDGLPSYWYAEQCEWRHTDEDGDWVSCGAGALRDVLHHEFAPYASMGEPPKYRVCTVCGLAAKDHPPSRPAQDTDTTEGET